MSKKQLSYGIYIASTAEATIATKDSIIEVLSAINETRFGDKVALKALDVLQSTTQNQYNISNCNVGMV